MTFSAAPSALGYLHQLRFALLMALEDEDRSVRLEVLDDVELLQKEGGRSLIQLKRVNVTAKITDAGSDLWKTIRIWSEHLHAGRLTDTDKLLLVTTASASEGSVAAVMGQPLFDVEMLVKRLEQIADASANVSLSKSFAAFLKLTPGQRIDLVRRIRVISAALDIDEVARELERKLALAVEPEHRNQARARVEGWWMDEAIRHLKNGGPPIPSSSVFAQVRDIAGSFGPLALPIDFHDASPAEGINALEDPRPFVLQLKAVEVSLGRVEKAILDYYRAFEQRARWVREDLLVEGEMDRYDDRLVDEWERVRLAIEDELDLTSADEEQLRRAGREVLRWVELKADLRIRERVTHPFVMRGSYHMLANTGPECRVWWHPQFRDRVKTILDVREEVVR